MAARSRWMGRGAAPRVAAGFLGLWAAIGALSSSAATLHFPTEAGMLMVEVNDPAVHVALDRSELRITGAGAEEICIATGPHLFASPSPDQAGPRVVLTITRDDRVAVIVRAAPGLGMARAPIPGAPSASSTDRMHEAVRSMAGRLVGIRNELDEQVWAKTKARWTTTEAAKLLIAFYRGDGALPGVVLSPIEATRLRVGLVKLRTARTLAYHVMTQLAEVDAEEPASPLCGSWEITDVRGAGGLAADALEIYHPDPVGRKFVAANRSAALLTGAGFWLFDAEYPSDGPGAIDLSAVVRGDTTYRGRFEVDGSKATLRISPMNAPRPDEADGDPTDGGFVLHMRRVAPE